MAADAVLEEVRVTAQRRDESAQAVGLSVTALVEDDLLASQLRQPIDIANAVPNLQISNTLAANPSFTLRGVGISDYSPFASSAVGIYVDEVFLASTSMMSFQLLDLDRIEVLKGPQGTLYGRNTSAGAIKFLSNMPDDITSLDLTVGYSNEERTDWTAVLNGALTDTLNGRLAFGATRQRGGFYYNRLTDSEHGEIDSKTWRASVDWQPTEQLSLLLSAHGQDAEMETQLLEHMGLFDGFDALGYRDTDDDPFAGDLLVEPFLEDDNRGGLLRANWYPGELEFTSITAYEDFRRDQVDSSDGSPFSQSNYLAQTHINQVSQELRVARPTSGGVTWQAGLFYADVDIDNVYVTESLDLVQTIATTDNAEFTETMAVFGQWDIPLRDRLLLVTGGRYSWEQKDFTGSTTDNNPNLTSGMLVDPTVGSVVLAQRDDVIESDGVSLRLALEFAETEDRFWYGSVNRGFKAGGFNGQLVLTDAQLEPFDDEVLTAWEIGLKSQWLQGRVRWNSSVFYYDYEDVQLVTSKNVRAPGGEPVTLIALDNASDAQIQGLESELNWLITPGLETRLSVALLDGELTDFNSSHNVDMSGNRMSGQPDWSAHAMLRYERELSGGMTLSLQGDVTAQDEAYLTANNNPLLVSDSYWLLDGRITLSSRRQDWDVSLWGANLTDEVYVTQGLDISNFGFNFRGYGQPRTYGATVAYHFSR